MEAEIRVMSLQAKEPQGLPASHQKPGQTPGTDSLIAPGGPGLTDTELRLLSSNGETINFRRPSARSVLCHSSPSEPTRGSGPTARVGGRALDHPTLGKLYELWGGLPAGDSGARTALDARDSG